MSLPATLSDAAELLAQRAVELRQGAPRLTKEAMDKTAFFGNIGAALSKLDPAAKMALLGAGGGAMAGLGSSLTQDKKKRHTLSSMLTGAAAGGALGGGIGLIGKGAAGSEAKTSPTEFKEGGKTWRLKPGVKITPEIAKMLSQADKDRQGSGIFGHIPWLTAATAPAAAVANEARLSVPTALNKPGKWVAEVPASGTTPAVAAHFERGPVHDLVDQFRQSGHNLVNLDYDKAELSNLPKDITSARFRRSDLFDFLHSKKLNEWTKGRAAKLAPENVPGLPNLIQRGSKESMIRGGLKYGLGATAMGLGENLLKDKLQQWSGNSRYRNLLSQYAEPTGS